MLSSLLSIIGVFVLSYVFWNVKKINKEKEKMREELSIVYSIGLKEYNKLRCTHLNQSKTSIIS